MSLTKKSKTETQIDGQMSIFDFLAPPEPPKIEYETPEADKLRANGWKNMYDETPPAGFYEVCDINKPNRIWVTECNEDGSWWNPNGLRMSWWRPLSYKSDEEIYRDAILHGSGFAGGKKRIIDFFAGEYDEKKRAEFLKNEYGVGGWTTDYGCVDHNAGGLDFSYKEEYKQANKHAKIVHSGWPMVAKDIEYLIQRGIYTADVEPVTKHTCMMVGVECKAHTNKGCRMPDKCGLLKEVVKENNICKYSEHTCNKEELWRVAEEIGEDCSRTCCRSCDNYNCGARCNGAPKDKPIEKYGVTWQPISIKPTQDKPMEILGCYKYNNKENWSCCPATLIDGDIVARDVPIDIPTPEWKYWRYKEQTKACADCINCFEEGCIINNNFAKYHKYDDWFALPKCETWSHNLYYPKSMSLCENKDNCDDYPIYCKGQCFWCHKNPNLSGDNCLNCMKYKIECFPEHATVHGKCEKYEVVPEFYHIRRCQLCKYWSCSADQPPAGWGINGYCSLQKNKTEATGGCAYFEREENETNSKEKDTDM